MKARKELLFSNILTGNLRNHLLFRSQRSSHVRTSLSKPAIEFGLQRNSFVALSIPIPVVFLPSNAPAFHSPLIFSFFSASLSFSLSLLLEVFMARLCKEQSTRPSPFSQFAKSSLHRVVTVVLTPTHSSRTLGKAVELLVSSESLTLKLRD